MASHSPMDIQEADITVDESVLAGVLLCRGPGHSKCSNCFVVDDQFGRSWRCRRQCAVVDGVWGPTVCSEECVQEEGELDQKEDEYDKKEGEYDEEEVEYYQTKGEVDQKDGEENQDGVVKARRVWSSSKRASLPQKENRVRMGER